MHAFQRQIIYSLLGAASCACIGEAPGLGSTCSIDTGAIMMHDGFLDNFQSPGLTAKKAINELVTFLSLLQQLRSFYLLLAERGYVQLRAYSYHYLI